MVGRARVRRKARTRRPAAFSVRRLPVSSRGFSGGGPWRVRSRRETSAAGGGAGAELRREEDPADRAFTGGDALIRTLLDHGVDTAFGVPGESYLAVLEALRGAQDRLRFVVTRHESGATFAACAYGRLARKPGVAFVTRGPGATNGAIGLHTARQDSVPLLLFIGQVPSGQRGARGVSGDRLSPHAGGR